MPDGQRSHLVLTLITGPVRSGKSRFAERRAARNRGPVIYLATAKRYEGDLEWAARLARHLERRPSSWRTIETAGLPDGAIEAHIRTAPTGTTVIVDSLGTWLADRMDRTIGDDPVASMTKLDLIADCFADACIAATARIIIVGEEVGWGIVPDVASARIFRDVLGRLQQRLARQSRAAFLVVAGYALDLKTHGESVSMRRPRPVG